MADPESTSILADIKAQLGLTTSNTAFDRAITLHINSAFMTLHQLGLGPIDGFAITGGTEKWDAFFDDLRLGSVQTYVYYDVRLVFDPPKTAHLLTSWEKIKTETQWRLTVQANPRSFLDPNAPNAFVWELDLDGHFPEDAQIGDVGFNPFNRKIWRKVA